MKHCPFCGHDTASVNSWHVEDLAGYLGHNEYAYICQNCGARGPNDVNPTKAEEMWNLRRPDDARVAELAAALRETLRYIEDEAKALDATYDNWPIVKQARTSLARLPSPSGEGGGETGE